jgi:hypothetical protein
VSETCRALHQLVQELPRFGFPYDGNLLPRNGIYVLFEVGESGHGADRIVRVGTHTGTNQLRSRLRQHFLLPNKDRSIFRKNVGRALLHRDQDPLLEHWELDLTTRASKVRYRDIIDKPRVWAAEERVSETIQTRFSFAVVQVAERAARLRLEGRMISTVSRCIECGASKAWLGNHSPKEKIRRSGLWQVNELYQAPLSDGELDELRAAVLH